MWQNFEIFAIITFCFWFFAVCVSLIKKNTIFIDIGTIGGIISLSIFICLLWLHLQRPPLRTLGETRLWYSLFLAISGYVIFKRWNISLMHIYSLGMAILFLLINYLKPEIHSKTLMPALQSVWFVPHVIVYMIAYALLGLSALFALQGLFFIKGKEIKTDVLIKVDTIIWIGFGFLSLGLIFGALWAKEAWGHYWTWDPKETWAFITWAVYLIYIHLRTYSEIKIDHVFIILIVAFIVLLICWFGINYLAVAQNSVHVYSN